jgi:dienelactone hydrolase
MQMPFRGTCSGSSSRGSSSQPQELIYMHTTADKVTNASQIEELIGTQRQQGRTVTAYRYQDSSHVGPLNDHPDDYHRAIDTALRGAMGRAGAKEEQR